MSPEPTAKPGFRIDYSTHRAAAKRRPLGQAQEHAGELATVRSPRHPARSASSWSHSSEQARSCRFRCAGLILVRSRRMRIFVAITYYAPHVSGVTVYARRLVRRLTKDGHEVTVLTSRYRDDLPRMEQIDGATVRPLHSPLPTREGRDHAVFPD